jgi:hypothetical protein
MSLEAERVFLSKRFTQSGVDLPVVMPNIDSDIPKEAPYGEFHIISNAPPITMGGQGKGKVRRKYVGFVQLTVWVPANKGTKGATMAGDKFKDIFAGKLGRDTAGSVYEFGAIQKFTPTTKTGWSVSVFRVPYCRSIVESIALSI